MSYQKIATPRAYVDMVQPLLVNGTITGTDQITGSGLLSTASSIIQLFDNKPNNTITIGGNGASTTQYITLDTNIDTDDGLLGETMFIAILGHNFDSSDVKFLVQTDDASNFSSAQTQTLTQVCNAAAVGSGYMHPANDGWSLVTYTQNSDNRYQRIKIDSNSGNYDADIKIGCIVWGVVYDFPNAPDLNIKRTFTFDGLKINESLGGQKYGIASYLTNSSWTSTSAWDTSAEKSFKSGRQKLEMSFSFLSESNAFPSQIYDVNKTRTDDAIVNRIIMMTNGGMFPFILQYDNTDATIDDGFLWCRLDNEPSFNQVAYGQYNTTLSFVEEF